MGNSIAIKIAPFWKISSENYGESNEKMCMAQTVKFILVVTSRALQCPVSTCVDMKLWTGAVSDSGFHTDTWFAQGKVNVTSNEWNGLDPIFFISGLIFKIVL